MAEYTVYFGAYAGAPVTVNIDIEPNIDRDDAREKIENAAWNKLDTTLCHHCARKIDLGDFEPEAKISGFDPEGNE